MPAHTKSHQPLGGGVRLTLPGEGLGHENRSFWARAERANTLGMGYVRPRGGASLTATLLLLYTAEARASGGVARGPQLDSCDTVSVRTVHHGTR